MSASKNIVPQAYRISKSDRQHLNGHKPCIVWLTGLSGSGKSTLANALEQQLHSKGIRTYVLDGDNIRNGLNSNLDFSEAGRKENIRRIGEVAKLFVDAGVVVITAFISPFRSDRDNVRKLVAPGEFFEVFVDCPLEVCETRDMKGLYKKARNGEIADFTGISSPFEPPLHPELTVNTHLMQARQSTALITESVLKRIQIKP
ncbi:MAG TPA: adenylyl-sulfate kinase [Bacteroidia bacterium]|nr:adenylyl-sulfate kinase [Bacteroidia bacterium]